MSSDKAEPEQTQPAVEEELEEAKRFFALKKWNEAADAYAQVLELLREQYEEEDPIFAPLYHRYGHSLLEHAIATSGALGGSKDAFEPEPKAMLPAKIKEPAAGSSSAGPSEATAAGSSKANGKPDPRFTFGGDAEESEEEEETGAAAAKGEGEEDDDDDLALAFTILELARRGYEKVLEGEKASTLKTLDGEEWNAVMIKSQLAEVLNDLADVGLESENFQQASADYKSSLELLDPLLQPHSRRLADAYLRLGLALEYNPDASLQASAEKYVMGACRTLEKRVDALLARQRVLKKDKEIGEADLAAAEAAASDLRTEKAEIESVKRLQEEGVLVGGKDKAVEEEAKEAIFEKDDVAAMDSEQVDKEHKDILGLLQDLRLKMEEYANVAPGSNAEASSSSGATTAKEKVQQAINEALLGSSTNALGALPPLNPNAPVNDLNSMVKKKKKPEESKANGKRKEVTGEEAPLETNKKVKVDE